MQLRTLDVYICGSDVDSTYTHMLKSLKYRLSAIMACFIHMLFNMYEEEGTAGGVGGGGRKEGKELNNKKI